MTLKEVKEKTLEILGSTDEKDVEHITEETINAEDFFYPEPESKEIARSTLYGHDMAYVYSERYQEYGYNFSTGVKNARSPSCGNDYGYFAAHSEYDHDKIDDCTSRDASLKFTPK